MAYLQQAIHRLFNIKRELKEVYFNLTIDTFALSLVSVFIPIYVFNIALDLNLALLFIAVTWLAIGLFSPIAASIASIIGVKHTILLRLPVQVVFLALLLTIPETLGYFAGYEQVFILAIAFIGGVADSLYWTSLNGEFVKNMDKIHQTEEIGALFAAARVGSVVAPALGGIVLTFLGFNILFTIVIILILSSIIPLLRTGDYKGGFRLKMDIIGLKSNRRLAFALFLQGMTNAAEAVMWPLYIFFLFDEFVVVGLASTASGIGIAILTVAVGRFAARFDRRKMIRIGGVAYACLWLLRPFGGTLLEIVLLSFTGGLLLVLINIPLFSIFADFASENIMGRVVFRELWLNTGRVLLLLALLFVPTMRFEAAFVAAGIAALLFLVT
ncbi:MAG: MFS transporter [Candidatus Aenigmarchaeota archaeon]|nr:MFS transporter [Candidatus Aenigmarchaeota archaeon]